MNSVGADSLTKRFSLTFVSNALQQGARLLTNIVVTPIIVRGLGVELYGALVMIQQVAGWLGFSDLRTFGTMRYLLAVRQHDTDARSKRRLVGSALVIWAATFPLLLAVGGGMVWFAPELIRTASPNARSVQIAMAFAVLGIAMDRILSLPSSVLRGVNLEYKSMGLNAFTTVFTGGLTAMAVLLGWGLPGVVGSGLIGLLTAAVIRLRVAQKVVTWFGADRPKRHEVTHFARVSAWLVGLGVGNLMLEGADILLVGFLLGPSAAAVYSATGLVLRFAKGPLKSTVNAGSIGLAGLCGEGNWERVKRIRIEMLSFSAMLFAIIGSLVLSLNQSIINVWLKKDLYAGPATNFLFVLIIFVEMLYSVESVIADGVLEFRRRAISSMIGGTIIVSVGSILTQALGLAGMALVVLAVRSVVLVYVSAIVGKHLNSPLLQQLSDLIRPFILISILFIGSFSASFFVVTTKLLVVAGQFALVTLLSALLMWYCGFSHNQRQQLLLRFGSVWTFFAQPNIHQ
jgi:hypothetical protein